MRHQVRHWTGSCHVGGTGGIPTIYKATQQSRFQYDHLEKGLIIAVSLVVPTKQTEQHLEFYRLPIVIKNNGEEFKGTEALVVREA